MIATPIFMATMLINFPYHYLVSLILFIAASLTDMIDGKIARQFNMITTIGKILDPLADKATQFSLILCLALKHPVLWYLVVLFVIKESFMLIMGWLTLRKGKMLNGALMSGKICTTVLFLSLILLVMLPSIQGTALTVIVCVDALFMLIAFADYIRAYFGKNKKIYDIDQNDRHG